MTMMSGRDPPRSTKHSLSFLHLPSETEPEGTRSLPSPRLLGAWWHLARGGERAHTQLAPEALQFVVRVATKHRGDSELATPSPRTAWPPRPLPPLCPGWLRRRFAASQLPSSSPPLAPSRWASQDEFDLPPDNTGAEASPALRHVGPLAAWTSTVVGRATTIPGHAATLRLLVARALGRRRDRRANPRPRCDRARRRGRLGG
jgi:hypothetical protein